MDNNDFSPGNEFPYHHHSLKIQDFNLLPVKLQKVSGELFCVFIPHYQQVAMCVLHLLESVKHSYFQENIMVRCRKSHQLIGRGKSSW